jgi:hypothetical protein
MMNVVVFYSVETEPSNCRESMDPNCLDPATEATPPPLVLSIHRKRRRDKPVALASSFDTRQTLDAELVHHPSDGGGIRPQVVGYP